jgi:hypothetical protein
MSGFSGSTTSRKDPCTLEFRGFLDRKLAGGVDPASWWRRT